MQKNAVRFQEDDNLPENLHNIVNRNRVILI